MIRPRHFSELEFSTKPAVPYAAAAPLTTSMISLVIAA